MGGIDGMLFDLDDTLVDWWGSIRRCVGDLAGDDVADALLAWAAEHTWTRREDVVVHRNTWKLHELAHETWPAALPHHDPEELALLRSRFLDELWVGFFPDVVPVLDELAERTTLGLLSNNPYVPAEVRRLRLDDWFTCAPLLPRDAQKPDPAAFVHGVEALGTDPSRTLFVGDSVASDIEGALAAGLVPVWVDRWGDGWLPPPGVHRVSSLAELPTLVDRLDAAFRASGR